MCKCAFLAAFPDQIFHVPPMASVHSTCSSIAGPYQQDNVMGYKATVNCIVVSCPLPA